MGGGKRRVREPRKFLGRISTTAPSGQAAVARGGSTERETDLDTPLCERAHAVSFRLLPGLAATVEEAIGIRAGSPPVVVAHGQEIGVLNDERQRQTLQSCLDQGYAIFGRVTVADPELGEALAEVTGVRVRE